MRLQLFIFFTVGDQGKQIYECVFTFGPNIVGCSQIQPQQCTFCNQACAKHPKLSKTGG